MTMTPHDYANIPHVTCAGYKSSNNKYRTRSMFVEMNDTDEEPLLSLGDTAIEREDGSFIPSCRMIYIYASSEWDAMMKMVGNLKHWETLKQLKWFSDELKSWQAEWAMLVEHRARMALEIHSLKNPSAAKVLFDAARGAKGVGRPTKKKATKSTGEDEDLDSDASRILQLVKSE